jgi:hypothetical protein
MTRGKQKIEAQKRANERKVKEPQSQLAARQAGINFVCNVCKVIVVSSLFSSHTLTQSVFFSLH